MWYDAHLTLIQSSFIYILLAVSLQVALRSGSFSLASVGFFGIGGYAAGILANHGYGQFVCIGFAGVLCAVGGYVLALPLSRLRGLYLGLVTVAFDLILNVVAVNGGSLTGGALGLYGIPAIVNTGTIVGIVVVALVLVSQLERRNFGRSFEALRLNEEVAASMGIEVVRQRNFAFALSAVLGGLAGALNVLTFTTVNPTSAGFELVVLGLTMAVLGGVNSWLGAAIGAVIVTWLPQMLGAAGEWRQVVYGGIVVIVAVFAPTGILGILTSTYRWVRRQVGGPRRGPTRSVGDPQPSDVTSPAAMIGES
jgi:branched-chain amino acid transport system permease protein